MTSGSVLVLGGARSGKSAIAERIVGASGHSRIYVATASAGDEEMRERIHRHQARRDGSWTNVEEPLDLVGCLEANSGPANAVVVDCLTVWLSNQMMENADIDLQSRQLAGSVAGLRGLIVFVSNEVGAGIVPDNALARRFRDAQGLLNQMMADVCETVLLTVAGQPLAVKGNMPL